MATRFRWQTEWDIHLKVAGDSEGATEWRLRRLGDGRTSVHHVWDVEVRRPALRLMSRLPGAGTFFERRHYATMARGRRDLEALLNREGQGTSRGRDRSVT